MNSDSPGGHRPPGDDAALWRQADRIFDHLLDLKAEERTAALGQMKMSDAVRHRVQRLLAAHQQSGTLDQPHQLLANLDPAHFAADLQGRRIGKWTLGREMGRGGMSVVYAASRPAGAGNQQAALKILTFGALISPRGRERFLREQGILARLKHPNIAALLDTGALDDGTPWMAMARVDGTPIDQWCRDKGLDVRATIQLFLQVCDAVRFAHRKLVIHRDIKPSNVLVDRDGHVHLLDFGIAHLADEQGNAVTRIMAATPRFASPEQLAGADPSISMDVYGMGALLYCMLTGEAPSRHDTRKGHGVHKLASQCCRVQDPQRAKRLQGDLDVVLETALAESPQDRYAIVSNLATDLHNWLQDRPVNARRAGRMYRLRKFALRNRWGVAASLALMLAIGSGLGISLWQAREAQSNAARATAIRNFMVNIFQASDPDVAAGTDPPASVLLERSAERVRLQFSNRPLLRAEILAVIGGIQLNLGQHTQAKTSLEEALNLFQEQAEPNREWAAAKQNLATLLYYRGNYDRALAELHHAEQLAVAADLSDSDPLRIKLAMDHANLLIETGHADKAVASMRKQTQRLRETGMTDGQNYISALEILGAALNYAGQHHEAIQVLRQALEVSRTHDKGNATFQCHILNDLGRALQMARRLDESGKAYSSSIACSQRYYGPDHTLTLTGKRNLAWVLHLRGRSAEAAAEFTDVLNVVQRSVDDEPSTEVAELQAMIALTRDAAGMDSALPAMESAYREMQRLREAGITSSDWIEATYGLLLFEHGDPRAQNHLLPIDPTCNQPGKLTLTHQHICVASMLLALDAGKCLQIEHTAAWADRLSTHKQPGWLAGFWLARQGCARTEKGRKNAMHHLHSASTALAEPPAWLASRMPADVDERR